MSTDAADRLARLVARADVVFHVSDGPVASFAPRPSPPRSSRPGEPLVWAITGEQLARQLLPRDCPRVFVAADAATTAHDRAAWLATGRRMWVAPSCRTNAHAVELHVHVLPSAPFAVEDATAGYVVSREAVVPLDRLVLDDVAAALATLGVELLSSDDLVGLADRVRRTSLAFSLVRLHLVGEHHHGRA